MNRFMIVSATITTVRRLDNCGRFHTAWVVNSHSRKPANDPCQSFGERSLRLKVAVLMVAKVKGKQWPPLLTQSATAWLFGKLACRVSLIIPLHCNHSAGIQ
jgi:hypothetical protein